MPRSRDEFLDEGQRALERHDRAIGETVTLLDGWLVTLSSAALAAPSVFSSNARLETGMQWILLAGSYASFGLTIATILARRLMQNSRVGHHAKILKTLTDEVRDAPPPAFFEVDGVDLPDVVEQINKLEGRAASIARKESHLRWISVVVFVLGMSLMGCLALVKALPAAATRQIPAAVAAPRSP